MSRNNNNRRGRRNPNDANVNKPKEQETPAVDPVEATQEVESDVVEAVADVEAPVEEPAEPDMDVAKKEPASIVIPGGPNVAGMLSKEVIKDMIDLKTPPIIQDIVDKKIQDAVKQTDEELLQMLREDVPANRNDVPVAEAEEPAVPESEAPAPDVDPEKPFGVVFTESMANRDERQIDIFRNRAEKIGVIFDEIESRRFAARVDALTFRRKLLAVGIKTRIAVYK